MWPGRFYFTFTAFAFGVIEIKQNIFSPEAYETSIITGVFLKPTINRAFTTDQLPTDQPSTYHQPPTNQLPTKCPNHQPTDHRPIRNLRTKNSITNFKWISDKKMWGRVINTISRMWVIICRLKPECVIDKIKTMVLLFKDRTYHTETAFE